MIFYRFITSFGSWQIVSLLFIIFLLFFSNKPAVLPFYLFASCVPILFSHIIKIIVKKPRRKDALLEEKTYAFPSSHSTIAVAFYGFLLAYFTKTYETATWAIIFIPLIALICYSRIYLKVHDWHDVSAGILLGATGLVPYLIYS